VWRGPEVRLGDPPDRYKYDIDFLESTPGNLPDGQAAGGAEIHYFESASALVVQQEGGTPLYPGDMPCLLNSARPVSRF
jgi:hypothetical protein